jgi:hypothetical protein
MTEHFSSDSKGILGVATEQVEWRLHTCRMSEEAR